MKNITIIGCLGEDAKIKCKRYLLFDKKESNAISN